MKGREDDLFHGSIARKLDRGVGRKLKAAPYLLHLATKKALFVPQKSLRAWEMVRKGLIHSHSF